MNNFEHKKKKYLRIFWVAFITPIVVIALLFYLISAGKLGYMPKFEELENPNIDLATQIITEDHELLGKFFLPRNNRTNVPFSELSPYLVNALISIEDIRFYQHSGIDPRGVARAFFYLGKRGGASTITQQLAKLLYHQRSTNFFKRVWQKLNEWVIAVRLEKSYTKEEILSMYLNQIDFLNLAVGIKSAARVYFNTVPDSLNIQEAATIAGMVQNPSIFNPLRRPDTTVYRRNIVLRQMEKYNYITQEVYDSVKALPLEIDYQRVDHSEGYGTYFREYLRSTMTARKPERADYGNYRSYQEDSAAWMQNPLYGWVNKNLKPDGTPYSLYSDGLRIYTTINYTMQQYAEEAVKEHLGGDLQPTFFREKEGKPYAPFARGLTKKERQQIMNSAIRRSDRYKALRRGGMPDDSIKANFEKPVEMEIFSWGGDIDTVMTPLDSIKYYKHILRTGLMSVDPRTGYVKAYVGGNSLKHFKYDHVMEGKRQPGSLFKPFLYVLAWQEGYSPCKKVPVVPQIFEDPVNDTTWQPRTTGTKYIGTQQTLKWGLAKSENLISAWLLKQFNPQSIVDIAHKVGIESPIDPVPSMIYGVSDMRVYEMVSAFGTFANKGVNIQPIFVTRIEDKNGNLLSTFMPRLEEAINDQTAYLMLNAMKEATNSGTAIRLRTYFQFEAEIASKTGTTQNHSDGWFMGIVPNLVTGIWVGAEDRSVHFDELSLGSGSNMALPIWGHYMSKVYADSILNITQKDTFEVPEYLGVEVDCDAYERNTYDTPVDYSPVEIGY